MSVRDLGTAPLLTTRLLPRASSVTVDLEKAGLVAVANVGCEVIKVGLLPSLNRFCGQAGARNLILICTVEVVLQLKTRFEVSHASLISKAAHNGELLSQSRLVGAGRLAAVALTRRGMA